jgi:hypothetical protein
VASGKKKTFDFKSKSPSLVVTKGDESRFGDIFIRETFDSSRNEVTRTGSVGSYYRCLQLRDTGGTIARNSNCTLVPVEFDHSWSGRFREGTNLLNVPKADITTVEALPYSIHQLLTKHGADMFSLELGVISFDDFHDQILSKRVTIYQSQKAIDIMANQLHGMFKPQDFIDAVRNRRLLHFIASNMGLTTDSVKSLIYPRQLYGDGMRRMEGVRTRFVSLENLHIKNSPEIQKELKALFESTQDFVAENISIINEFRSSQPYLAGTAQDAIQQSFVNRLVAEHNDLVDLAAHLHNISGTPWTAPSRSKIVNLAAAINRADEKGYTDQWLRRGATPMTDELATEESLNSQIRLILSTNNLLTDPPLVGKDNRFL